MHKFLKKRFVPCVACWTVRERSELHRVGLDLKPAAMRVIPRTDIGSTKAQEASETRICRLPAGSERLLESPLADFTEGDVGAEAASLRLSHP